MKILIRGDFVYGFLEHAAKAIGIDLINAPRCDNPQKRRKKSINLMMFFIFFVLGG